MPHLIRNLALLILASALCSCATRTFQDPIPVMTSHRNDPAMRLAAVQQAATQCAQDPQYDKALDDLAWGVGQPEELRLAAMDELIRRDEAGFRKVLARRIVLKELSHGVLEHIYQVGLDRHWPDFTPTVVYRYMMREYATEDADRIERSVLTRLNPGKTVEQVIFEVFTNAAGNVAPEHQVAAWELLSRLTKDRAKLMALLHSAPANTALVADLKAGADELHVLPRNKEGRLWLAYLREPQRRELWNAYRAQVAKLNPEQLQGLELRHMVVLLHSDDAVLARDRDSLMQEVQARIDAGVHHYITVDPEGGTAEMPQRFIDWRDKLNWADLLTLRQLLGVLDDRAVAAQLFAQADADVQDMATEFGGVLDRKGDGFDAIGYPPLYHRLNTEYLPAQDMIQRCYTGVAHYHFHAQKYGNAERAAPGQGDLNNADRLNFNFLVFIFIDRNHLNVDYYQSGRVSIDLGTIQR
jgi:hypothetical protein